MADSRGAQRHQTRIRLASGLVLVRDKRRVVEDKAIVIDFVVFESHLFHELFLDVIIENCHLFVNVESRLGIHLVCVGHCLPVFRQCI